MSLAINTTTSEGIVLAADSRQSYRNRKGMARIGSDNASKLFQLNKRVGVAVTGLAFLPEDGVPKNISKFIDEFKRETDVEKLDVKDVAEKNYFPPLHYLPGHFGDPVVSPDGRWVAFTARHVYGPEDLLIISRE